jgi:hypothetical protein
MTLTTPPPNDDIYTVLSIPSITIVDALTYLSKNDLQII